MRANGINRCGASVAALLLSVAMTAQAADIYVNFPPPGLYRIDTDATMNWPIHGAGMRQSEDGATGDVVKRSYADGHASVDQHFQGKGPITLCRPPRVAVTELPVACREHSVTRIKDGLVLKGICPSGTTTLTIHKLDANTWDYVSVTSLVQSPTGPDLTGIRRILEQTAKSAPTAEERAKAEKQLAELPAMQREMSKSSAMTMESLEKIARTAKTPEEAAMIKSAMDTQGGKKPMMEATSRQRWTRIADSCAAAPKSSR